MTGRSRRADARPVVTFPLWVSLLLLAGGDAAVSGSVSSGVTVSAVLTLVLGGWLLALMPGALTERGLPASFQVDREPLLDPKQWALPVSLLVFLAWAFTITAVSSPTKYAIQNLACYVIFVGAIIVTSRTSSRGTASWFFSSLLVVGWVRAGATLLLFAVNGARAHQQLAGATALLLALLCMIPLSGVHRLLPYVLLVEVAATTSRTATVAGVIAVTFIAYRRRRGSGRLGRFAFRWATLAVGIYLAIEHVQALHDRLFVGDRGGSFQGTTFNTSGRNVLWHDVIVSADKHPWIGQGAGSATAMLRPMFPAGGEPHNDYLRLWHDFGYIGAAMFVIGLLALLRATIVRVRRGDGPRELHAAAALALFTVAAIAITDNVLIYFFIVLPLGTVIGMSLAYDVAARPVAQAASSGATRNREYVDRSPVEA